MAGVYSSCEESYGAISFHLSFAPTWPWQVWESVLSHSLNLIWKKGRKNVVANTPATQQRSSGLLSADDRWCFSPSHRPTQWNHGSNTTYQGHMNSAMNFYSHVRGHTIRDDVLGLLQLLGNLFVFPNRMNDFNSRSRTEIPAGSPPSPLQLLVQLSWDSPLA